MLVWHFNKKECVSKHRKIVPEQLIKETACRESGFVSWYYKQHLNCFIQFEIFITGFRKVSIRWSHRHSSNYDKGPNPALTDHSPFPHPILSWGFSNRHLSEAVPSPVFYDSTNLAQEKGLSLPFLSILAQEDRDGVQRSKAWWCARGTYSFSFSLFPL